MNSIIFVCLGNICRSPLAEGIAKKIAEEKNLNINIDSAGTGDWHLGEAPCNNSIKVAKQNGIDISTFRARKVTKEDFEQFDLVVALDDSNYSDLQRMGATNLVKLGEFGYDGADVPDPYFFNGFDGFLEVFKMVDNCVNNIFQIKFDN
ncbi:low molecular weight protein-tyrosine-phosphatase [Sulfurimonas sp. C5]|uniref:low molecular weight protein-tyrosine-phosphatase n=1 Tax=Sulfurimonas sp. C5 TaxID=3036947 RepID=UPI0024542F16|nr:low molecular weight protein-tyrosine-phosphatase [Sulfurimonas sp. C5]MDH4944589.1 low molecular weight phosphotyrosine protein phosphatase [Sulfurimonas sp. C5]